MPVFLRPTFRIALLISICAAAPCRAEGPRKFRIGLSTDLTGSGASYGLDVRDVLQFAVDKLGRGRYEILTEDDRCSAKDAVSIAHKFTAVTRVDAVVGPACSGSVLAAAPIYEKAKVPVMVTNASSPKISGAGDFVFRTQPSDAAMARLLFTRISRHHRQLALLAEQTDFAQGFKEAFLRENSAAQLEVSAADYLPETTDFRALLAKFKAARVPAFLIYSQSEINFIAILKQLREMTWHPQIYGAYWPGSKSFLQSAASLGEGILFGDTADVSSILDQDGRSLYAEFRARFGDLRSSNTNFAITFEGFRALRDALESGRDVREYLYKTRFNGMFGPFSFDRDGEIVGLGFALKRLAGGVPVEVPLD